MAIRGPFHLKKKDPKQRPHKCFAANPDSSGLPVWVLQRFDYVSRVRVLLWQRSSEPQFSSLP